MSRVRYGRVMSLTRSSAISITMSSTRIRRLGGELCRAARPHSERRVSPEAVHGPISDSPAAGAKRSP
jgi:hypothetical protein